MNSNFGTTALIFPVVLEEAVRSLHRRTAVLNRGNPGLKFGPASARWNVPHWSLPTGLDAFAAMYGGILRKPQGMDWVNNHTLAPYFGATLTGTRRLALQERLLTWSPGPRRPLLPIAISEWFTLHPRLCVECDQRSLEQRGFSHVPRGMLIPFLTRCPEHGELLKTFAQWSPSDRGPATQLATLPNRREEALAFAHASIELLRYDGKLLAELGELLQTRGMTSVKDRLRRAELVELLVKHASGRYEHPELNNILANVDSATRALSPLMSGRGCLHPAVAIALVRALREAPASQQLQLFPASRATLYPRLDAALRQCPSATAAASAAGVSVQTALCRAADLGLQMSRRPKVLTEQHRTKVLALLADGRSHASVALEMELSLATVYRVARGATQLSEKRRRRNALQMEEKVSAWIDLAKAHPDSTRTELRSIAPALFAWLYRNAPERFRTLHPAARDRAEAGSALSPSLNLPNIGSRAPEGAEFLLSRRLAEAAQAAVREGRARRTRTSLLSQAGRGSSNLVSSAVALHLDELSESTEAFVGRRIEAAALRLSEQGLPLLEWRLIKEAGLRAETVENSGVRVEEVARRAINGRPLLVNNG